MEPASASAVASEVTRRRSVVELRRIDPPVFFRAYFSGNRPCVLRGGAGHWPAVERWRSDDYLRQRAGYRPIAETTSTRDDIGFDHQSPIGPTRLAAFLDHYADDQRRYINDARMPGVLVSDLGASPLLDGFALLEDVERRVGMFMGGGEQFAPLHYDDEDNVYVLVAGKKIFTLFDIADFGGLYPHDDVYKPDFSEIADPDRVDLARHPRFAEVTRYDVELEPGDMLYVPGYWWHSVRSAGRSIALSYVRLDRRAQAMAFAKLLRAGVFPLDAARQAHIDGLLSAPAQTAAETASALDRGEIWWADAFETYARLVTLYTVALDGGGDLPATSDALERVKPRARAELLADADRLSRPVLYLMQNFFRAKLGIFRDGSAADDT